MSMGYFDTAVVDLKCGCQIEISGDFDAPRCRCGGGCWDDEGEWTFEGAMVTPCETHKEKFYPTA